MGERIILPPTTDEIQTALGVGDFPLEDEPTWEQEESQSFDQPDESLALWKGSKYDSKDIHYQASGQRRHLHHRYEDQSFGVCSVDLSGPHEDTCNPGHNIATAPARYFLVLTVAK